jgi:hypothetical protein
VPDSCLRSRRTSSARNVLALPVAMRLAGLEGPDTVGHFRAGSPLAYLVPGRVAFALMSWERGGSLGRIRGFARLVKITPVLMVVVAFLKDAVAMAPVLAAPAVVSARVPSPDPH